MRVNEFVVVPAFLAAGFLFGFLNVMLRRRVMKLPRWTHPPLSLLVGILALCGGLWLTIVTVGAFGEFDAMSGFTLLAYVIPLGASLFVFDRKKKNPIDE